MEQLIEIPKFLANILETLEYVPDEASRSVALIIGFILWLIGLFLLAISISQLNKSNSYKKLTLESYKEYQKQGRLGLLIFFIGILALLQYNLTTTIVLPSIILGILIGSLYGLGKCCIELFSGLVKIFSKPKF